MPVDSLIIKILSGRHEGASVPMAVSSLCIGRDGACDIVLTDDDVATVTITRDEEGNYLLQEGEKSRALVPPCVFLAGGVRLGLGAADVNFSEIKNAPPSLEEEAADGGGDASLDAVKKEAAVARKPSHGRAAALLSVALGMVLPFAASVAFFWSSLAASQDNVTVTAAAQKAPPLQAVRRLLARDNAFAHVVASPLPEGGIQLAGSVTHEKALARLRHDTEEWRALIQTHIVVTAQVAQSLRAGLAAYGLSLTVHDEGNGHFRVAGVVPSYQQYESAITLLKNDLPDAIVIHDQVITLNDFTSHLRDNIMKAHLAISLRLEAGALAAYGLLNEADFAHWQEVKGLLLSAFEGDIVMTDYVKAVPHFALHIQTVVKGPRSFIILRNRHMVEEGAPLSDGFTLASIKADRLLLRHGERDYDYIFSRHMETSHE